MARSFVIGLAVIISCGVVIMACGGNPSGVTVPVDVTVPSSSTIWRHYQSEVSIQWNGGSTDNVSIRLMKGGEILELLASSAPNSGTYILSDRVSPSWGTGADYTIRIEDGLGQVGTSQTFEIAVSEGAEIIQVSQPSSGTVWSHYQTDVGVSWSYPSGKAGASHLPLTGREGGAVLSGDEVDIELYQGENKVATLASGIPANAGNYNYPDPVPPAWGTGTDYRIRIVDDLGNFGYSGSFSIEEPSGQELINVTVPNSSTVWEYQQTGTTVQWEYPVGLGQIRRFPIPFGNALFIGDRSENVRMEIWKEGVKIGDYCGWVPNTGSYTRSESLPSAWGTGFNYQIKVVDSNSNYGLSENFMISGSIDVTNPNSSTVWEIGETNTQVQWSGGAAQIKLEVWYQGSKRGDYSGWIDNTGSYTRTAPIPDSWEIGQHFRIRVVEAGSNPNDGYSDEFQIFDDVNVTEPDPETSWAWGESGVTVQWSEGYSDSVMISLYKGGTYVGMVSEWIPNSGSFTRAEVVSSSWGTGSDYRVKLIGNLGSYGFSDYFSIWAYDITEPNSSTVWSWGQMNTQVLWEPGPGTIVRMEIWKAGSKIDDYCSWTDDDGEYTRTAAIPEAWGEGNNYQIKMIDDLGNVVWSQEFVITNMFLNEQFDSWNANVWGGNCWEYNNDQGQWIPNVDNGYASLTISDYGFGQIRTLDYFTKGTVYEYTFIPYLQSGGVHGDFAILGLTSDWFYYGTNTAAGIRLDDEGKVYVWYETPNGINWSVAEIGTYLVGVPVTMSIQWNNDGSMTIVNGSYSHTLGSGFFQTDSARLICVVHSSTDGYKIDSITGSYL